LWRIGSEKSLKSFRFSNFTLKKSWCFDLFIFCRPVGVYPSWVYPFRGIGGIIGLEVAMGYLSSYPGGDMGSAGGV